MHVYVRLLVITILVLLMCLRFSNLNLYSYAEGEVASVSEKNTNKLNTTNTIKYDSEKYVPASYASVEVEPQRTPSGVSPEGVITMPTHTDIMGWAYAGLEGCELDENGHIKITDPEKFEESLKRRQQKEEEEKAAMERMINPPKETKHFFPTPFFLRPWGGIASIPIFLIILGISVYILKCRDAKRMKK